MHHSKIGRPMSALGHKRTLPHAIMSTRPRLNRAHPQSTPHGRIDIRSRFVLLI